MQAKHKIVYKLTPRIKSEIHKNSGDTSNDGKMVSMDFNSILNYIEKYLPSDPIIMEVGAFNGNDTKKISLKWPLGKIYAFEPLPKNFANLKKMSLQCDNVICFPFDVSAISGTTNFFNPAFNASGATSQPLLSDKEHHNCNSETIFNNVITVSTLTLDDWAQQNSIDHLDLLWNMQGFELNTLKASLKLLKTVKVIYTGVEFETTYEGHCIYTEVAEFLKAEGFTFVACYFDESPQRLFGNALFVRQNYAS